MLQIYGFVFDKPINRTENVIKSSKELKSVIVLHDTEGAGAERSRTF